MLLEATLAVLLTLVSVVLTVLSALIERSGPVRLRGWAEEAGGRLLALFERPARFEAFRFVLAALARLAPLALLAVLAGGFAGVGPAWRVLPAIAAVALLVVAVEVVNRRLVGWDAEGALRKLTFLLRLLDLLLLPLVAVAAPLAAGVRPADSNGGGDAEDDDVSDEEIEAYIELGTREGILEAGEGAMLWGIVDFGDTQVRSVMTPRVDMVVAAADDDLESLAERFLDSGHSRIPLYEESIDRIVGMLHIRDLLRGLRTTPRPPARELAKAPFFVPERRNLDELLREMQTRRQQAAIVLDEYGGTAGLVTVEDLLEEIVGEIFDEDEVAEPEVTALPDGSWRLDGRTPVEELDELFGVDLEEEPYETVAGVVLSVHGSVPEPGEVIEAHGLRFVVEEVAGRRVQALRVEKIGPEAPAQIEEETA
jgi:CBS domain containing-hemolysin-like protein